MVDVRVESENGTPLDRFGINSRTPYEELKPIIRKSG